MWGKNKMHLKRQKAPKNWPIHRKGTKYVIRPNFNLQKGIPILIILRDMLKLAQNRREVKKALHLKQIMLNNKTVKNEKNSAFLFDTLTIIPLKKFYRIDLLKKGKFKLEEIKETEANQKVSKVVNKKILKNKKVQLNLFDGNNFISDIKCNINDSALIDFKEKKIKKCLPLKEKARAIIFAGKHSGVNGIIDKIKQERKMISLITNKEKINVLIKQVMVIE